MSREPLSDNKPRLYSDIDDAVEELKRWLQSHRPTGESCIRVSHNQGGVTAVKLATERLLRRE